jgi:hypothetical protein
VHIKHSMLSLCNHVGSRAITTGFTNGVTAQPIFYSNTRCSGGERRLIDCPKSGNTNPVCTHTRDAGITCQGGTDVDSVIHWKCYSQFKQAGKEL